MMRPTNIYWRWYAVCGMLCARTVERANIVSTFAFRQGLLSLPAVANAPADFGDMAVRPTARAAFATRAAYRESGESASVAAFTAKRTKG